MKQRFLYGLDALIYAYLAVVLHLALIGGFTVSLGPLSISANGYTNPLVALGALLALRRWLRGSLFDGFRRPFDFVVTTVKRSPALSAAWAPRLQTVSGFAAGVLLGAALVTGIVAVVTFYPSQGLVGRYFDNPDWSGTPVFTVRDREPSLRQTQKDWYATNYSVEWTGVIYIAGSSDYRFALESDDGSELWIGDELVVDNRGTHGSETEAGVARLEEGFHPIRIRYMQQQGEATLAATWTYEAILFPSRPGNGAFALFRFFHGFPAALLPFVILSVALLGACDLLLDKRRTSSLRRMFDVHGLLRAARNLATYAVELALLLTLALGLWVADILPWLATLFVLRRVLRGSFVGGISVPPFFAAEVTRWWSRVQAGFRRRYAARAFRAGLVAATVLTLGLVGVVGWLESRRGLTGRYYDNPDWTGDLITTAHDRELTRRRPIYDFVGDYFYSVEWAGAIHIPAPGDYRFALTSDGGSLLWIDDTLVVDNSGVHDVRALDGTARLTAGFHEIRVRYAHDRDYPELNDVFLAEWSRAPSEPLQPLSSATLFPESAAASRTAYAWWRLSRGFLAILSLVLVGGLTAAYLLAWHWLLIGLRAVEEHHVHIALVTSVALVYWVASFGGLESSWGFSKLQEFEAFRTMPIPLLAAVPLLAYRRHRARFESAITTIQMFLHAHPMAMLGAALLSVMVFFGLRNEFVNSDGAMYRWMAPSIVNERLAINFDEMWEQYLHAWFWHYTNATFGWSVRVSYQVASSIAGGVFILVLWSYARRLVPDAALAFFLLMVSGGYMQLFFGEVEHYTLVGVVSLAYFLASARFLQGKSTLVVPSAMLALAMTFHMLAGFLLPSVGFLYLVALRRRAYVQIALASAASAAVLAFAMLATGQPITALYQGSWGAQAIRRLVFAAAASTGVGEGGAQLSNWAFFAFDRYHWDQYNLLALMFPAHLALIPLLLYGRIRLDAINVHLLVAAAGMTFFQFNYRALLPLRADWNLFANAAVPIAILVSRNLLGAEGLRYRAEIVIGWVTLSCIHSYTWILSNHRFMP